MLKIFGPLFFILLFIVEDIFCQNNLILNGSFEELELVDVRYSLNGQAIKQENYRDTALFWNNKEISKDKVLVKTKYWYFQDSLDNTRNAFYSNTGRAKDGNVYSIIQFFAKKSERKYYVENLAGTLCKPMKKGGTYELTFYIRTNANYQKINSIGVHFSPEKKAYSSYILNQKKNKKKNQSKLSKLLLYTPTILKEHCQIELIGSNIDTYRLFSTTYTAQGGERYIYIGNLTYEIPEGLKSNNLSKRKKQVQNSLEYSYAIDEIKLIAFDSTEKCINSNTEIHIANKLKDLENLNSNPKETSKNITLNKKNNSAQKEIILKKLGVQYFNSNKYQLNNSQKKELKSLFQSVDFSTLDSVAVFGYADTIGSEEYNQDLSLNRAMAVSEIIRDFIYHAGHDINIIHKGKGQCSKRGNNKSSEPLCRKAEIILYY